MVGRQITAICGCGNPMHYRAKQCLDCRRKRATAECKNCGTSFQHKPSRPRSACSPACADRLRARSSSVSQSRKVDLVCEHCGSIKRVSPSYADRRFCSHRCAYDANSGEANPRWKGGITDDRKAFLSSMEWKIVRRAVWARDRRTCRRCGEVHQRGMETFHAHHIALYCEHPDQRLNPDNIVLLCLECHRFVHSRDNQQREFLLPLD